MNIVLFGATGMIGSRILDELVSRGHGVTAVIRDPAKLAGHENVIGTAGDILDADSVKEAVEGADVVVSAYGPGSANPDVLVRATASLLKGVAAAAVKRLIAVGGAGSLEVAPGMQLVDTPDFPAEWKGVALAHRNALELIKASALDWTSLSPAAYLHPGERTGKYRLALDQLITDEKGGSEISAEDFAIALADELENPQHIRQRFTVAW